VLLGNKLPYAAEDISTEYAVLDLTPELATQLLKMRAAAVAAAHDLGETFYCIVVRDTNLHYASLLNAGDAPDDGLGAIEELVLESGQWYAFDETLRAAVANSDWVRDPDSRSLWVKPDGVLWSANDQGYIVETDVISWDAIAAVARGENPFPVFSLPAAEDAPTGPRSYIVEYTAGFRTTVTVEPGEDLPDAIMDIEIPDDDDNAYRFNTFEVTAVKEAATGKEIPESVWEKD
jgi:hypothetical protein